MNEASERLKCSVEYLVENGLAKNQSEIARTLHVTYSTLNMAMLGYRRPPEKLLLNFCYHYPINIWWLWAGEGKMIADKKQKTTCAVRKWSP